MKSVYNVSQYENEGPCMLLSYVYVNRVHGTAAVAALIILPLCEVIQYTKYSGRNTLTIMFTAV